MPSKKTGSPGYPPVHFTRGVHSVTEKREEGINHVRQVLWHRVGSITPVFIGDYNHLHLGRSLTGEDLNITDTLMIHLERSWEKRESSLSHKTAGFLPQSFINHRKKGGNLCPGTLVTDSALAAFSFSCLSSPPFLPWSASGVTDSRSPLNMFLSDERGCFHGLRELRVWIWSRPLVTLPARDRHYLRPGWHSGLLIAPPSEAPGCDRGFVF